MKPRLLLLNLLLLAGIVFAATVLKQKYQESKGHQEQVLKQKTAVAPPPEIPPIAKSSPVAATTYAQVAQQMLFTRDRNPNVIVEPPKPPPVKVMPPLPFAYGVMDFGSGPQVLLAEKSGAQNKLYKIGDKIGEFKVLSVSNKEISFEWDGKEIKKRLEELADKVAASNAQAEPAPAPTGSREPPRASAPPPPPPPPAEPKPSKVEMGENRACQPGDSSPAGTIADGFKKVTKPSPFGTTCYWEPAK